MREKKVRDLEFDVIELEEENKQLKSKLKGKKKYRRSSKEDLRQDNEWMFDKANLASKINDLTREGMFPKYIFLKER